MSARLFLAVGLLLAAAACADDSVGPAHDESSLPSGSVPPEIVSWLQANVHPFDTALAGSGHEDLQFLKEIIGDARVVALGEATHGTREFFQMKHRVLEFLVEEMGFNVFAIEATWPEANRVNEYVHTGQGDPLVLLSGLYFWTWATDEVLDMILWMREQNQVPGDDPTVSFFGFDMQYPGMAIYNVQQFLMAADPPAATWATDAYGCMIPFANGPRGFPGGQSSYGSQPLEYRNACLGQLQAVHEHLLSHRVGYEATSSSAAFARAARSARLVVQFEELTSFRSPGARDRFMAENAIWLLDQAGPEAKIVLWAHNGHVNDDPYYDGGGSMGHHLRKEYGGDLVIVGFDFFVGEFQAITISDAGTMMGLNVHSVEPPPRGSYEYYFHGAGFQRFVLDTRGVPLEGPGTSWLAGPRRMRFIGAGYNASSQQYYFKELSLPTQFDAVIYFDRTDAAIGFTRVFPDSW